VNLRAPFPPLSALKGFVTNQLALLREDHLRPLNPTPYKVSVSMDLYHYIHDLWMQEIPVAELS
jgi:nicotinate phosphoribosyltransferase